jgi:hypothetical protein
VVIDNLDLVRIALLPAEAYPVLIVDAYAVLALAVAPQRFQPVSVWLPQIVQMRSVVQNLQLSPRNRENPAEPAALSRKKRCSVALSANDRIMCLPYHVERSPFNTHLIRCS